MRGVGLGLGLGGLLCIGLTGVLWGEWFCWGICGVCVFQSFEAFGLWSVERACLVNLVARVSVCCSMLLAVVWSRLLLICFAEIIQQTRLKKLDTRQTCGVHERKMFFKKQKILCV